MILSRGVAITSAAAAAVGIVAGGGLAFALGDESRVTGPQADRAVAAAVARVGGGTATDVEREGTGSAAGWEVEIVTRDGRQVEVLLDSGYRVVAVGEDAEDDAAGDD